MAVGGTKSRDPNSGASDSTVRSKVAVWQGIAEITCVVAGGIGEFSGAEPHVTADIVEEALCNTVRLGNADAIHRQVTHEVNEGRPCVHVRVEDHGTGISGMRPGLGTAYLDRSCADRWRRTVPTGGGCRLDAFVPISMP